MAQGLQADRSLKPESLVVRSFALSLTGTGELNHRPHLAGGTLISFLSCVRKLADAFRNWLLSSCRSFLRLIFMPRRTAEASLFPVVRVGNIFGTPATSWMDRG